jgi:hypothetical protein
MPLRLENGEKVLEICRQPSQSRIISWSKHWASMTIVCPCGPLRGVSPETSPGARPECHGFGRDPQPQGEPQLGISTTTKMIAKSGGPEDTAEADVRVRVRRIIVQIRSEHAGILSVVPVAPAKERPESDIHGPSTMDLNMRSGTAANTIGSRL